MRHFLALGLSLCLVACAASTSRRPAHARVDLPAAADTEPPTAPDGETEAGAEDAEPSEPPVLRVPQDDRRVGSEAAEQVRSEIGLVEDEELNEYLDAIGRRLARHAPAHGFEYRFAIVDQDAPNAFALPGGFIYVSRGLLALTNSEDELACVLGHEIVHASMRHAAARQQISGSPGLFQWFRMGQVAAYSRSQERAADRLGQGLAARAGYDPAGMASFLKSLEFTDRLQFGTSRIPSFLDTHPAPGRRATLAAERAHAIPWEPQPGIARDDADYLHRLEGLPVGGSAAEGVFVGSSFVHPDLGFSLRFPEGWETRNTRRAVGAVAPRRDAQVFLEHQGPGEDPEQAAAGYLSKASTQGLRVEEATPVTLTDSRAFRVRGSAATGGGPVRVTITFIARGGQVYRLTGVAASGHSRRYQGVFLNVARSFRPVTPELLAQVEETRLRVVEARSGESLSELSLRTANAWQLQQTAVMNDLFADRPLRAGQLVKVAVAERYQPAAPAP